MALFDSVLSEVSEKFDLGGKATPLLAGLLSLITNEQTGGLAGFIERFRQTGLGDLVNSWISTGSNHPITENQLQNVLGVDTINRLSSRAGITSTLATSALAYMVPRVIDLLTPNGTVPATIPTAVTSFLSSAGEVRREAATAGSSGLRWWPLLLIPLLAFLGYRYCNRPVDEAQTAMTAPTATATVTPSPSAVAAALGEFIDKRLPNGTVIRIPSNGVESKLIAFIEDPNRPVDKETWFSFDRLEFATNSSTLLPGSQEQLRNMAEILKAYPNVNVKIGGYTDNVGNDAYNLKLSTERARNTELEIEKLGINDQRLESEGYGKEHPVADNSTEEGRQRNRRIDVRVTKK
jgi:outer membrane protein OmpA-like peptidoglycan-associated protein/uncharacterized protein YidB (DUF937 family)